MIRIAYVINYIVKNGPSSVVLNIINNLDREKYDVSLITLFSGNNPEVIEYLKSNGVSVYECATLSRMKCLLGQCKEFDDTVKKGHYDILHTHGLIPDIVSSRLNTPVRKITTLHNNMYEDYLDSFGYFKANSRFKIDKMAKVDRFEHLQYITPATVQFIATHPEELRRMSSCSGIRIGKSVYQPERTLSIQNVRSYDIYENQVVLGFIRKMIDSIEELSEHCNSLLEQIPGNENYGDEYIYSSFFMFAETKRMLEVGLTRLTTLRTRFTRLSRQHPQVPAVRFSDRHDPFQPRRPR